MTENKLNTDEEIKQYIDGEIERLRERALNTRAAGAIDALQSLRVSLYGEMYPCGICGETEPHGHDITGGYRETTSHPIAKCSQHGLLTKDEVEGGTCKECDSTLIYLGVSNTRAREMMKGSNR